MMQLHTWCRVSDAQSFDPECFGLELLITAHNLDIEIVASNNVLLSPDSSLPVLICGDGEAISGFIEIVEYLRKQGMINYDYKDTTLQFYAEKMTTLSLYYLFEVKKNYEKVTRPSISRAIPFPMQYNLTVDLQNRVHARVKSDGFYLAKPQRDVVLATETGISKTHEKMLEEAKTRKESLKDSQKTAFVVAKADSIYKDICATPLDAEAKSPAYCIIAANALIQTLEMPEKTFDNTLKTYSSLAQMAEWAKSIDPKLSENKALEYNLTNYLHWRKSQLFNFFSA